MSYRLHLIISDVEESEIGPLQASLARQYGEVRVILKAIDDEPTDDETAADIVSLDHRTIDEVAEAMANNLPDGRTPQEAIKWLRSEAVVLNGTDNDKVRLIDATIAKLEARLDDTPPHGIERPGYWVDPQVPPTQGSGKQLKGVENVPCPTCGAPVGKVCMTTNTHGGYRRGYAHAARYRAHREAQS